MKKLSAIISILGVAMAVSGCSIMKKSSRETANSGDAMPLYPVNGSGANAPRSATSLNGHWYVNTVGTITLSGIEDDQWPFIDFVETEGRFYGNDGCNLLNGSYRVGPTQTLTLSEVAATMRLCEGDSLAYPIARALDATASYSVATRADGQTILSLHNSKNLTVMTLRKSDIDFLNGPWQVVGINGKEVNVADARLIFDVAEGKVTGNAGCNRLMGEITRNPQVVSSVQLSGLATTRMTCPDIATESALLIALEEVVSAKSEGNGFVSLLDSDGKAIVKLKRLSRADF